MAHADVRQWQRFGYPADIQLRYEPAGAQAMRELAAVSFDLSLGGMQLRAAGGLALGTRVTCRLPNAHGGLSLPGRVRWSQPDDARGSQLRFRLGVEFEPLRPGVHQNLQAIVSQVERAGEMVKVHMPSWSEPLCAVSEPSEHGVRLRLPLPFWSSGAFVRFEPLQAGQAFEGRVVSTQLQPAPGSQGVELEVLLSPCEPARKRRFLTYDDPVRAPTAQPAADAIARSREITEYVPLAVPKTRINAVLVQAAIVTALFWLGFGVTQYFSTSLSLSPARAPRLRSQTEARAPTQTETSLQAASTATFPALEVPKAPTLAETVVPPEPIAPVSEPEASQPQPSTAPRAASEQTLPAAQKTPAFVAPMLSSTHDITEIFVPVTGRVAGLTSALWVDPPAVVVDLPLGTLELSQARYDLDAGGVSALRVGRSRGVTQLRVYLTALLLQFDAVPARGGIVIRLRRDLQSLPH
jgi:hypothetical protein